MLACPDGKGKGMIYVHMDMIFGQKSRLKNLLKIKWDENKNCATCSMQRCNFPTLDLTSYFLQHSVNISLLDDANCSKGLSTAHFDLVFRAG